MDRRNPKCSMKNSETRRNMLSTTISPSEALGESLIDENGYVNYQKQTRIAKTTINGANFKSYNVKIQVEKE